MNQFSVIVTIASSLVFSPKGQGGILQLFKFSFACYYLCTATVILSGLLDQVTPLGGVTYVNCHAQGNAVYWLINGTDPQTREFEYISKGFQFTYDTTRHQNMLDEHNNTIRVEARLSNNNTQISCIVYVYGQSQFSQEEILIIAGK